MRHRLDVVVPLDPRNELQGFLAGAQAIGHGHPVGSVTRQGRDSLFEHLDLALIARRHELERDGRPASCQQLGYAHGPKPTNPAGPYDHPSSQDAGVADAARDLDGVEVLEEGEHGTPARSETVPQLSHAYGAD